MIRDLLALALVVLIGLAFHAYNQECKQEIHHAP